MAKTAERLAVKRVRETTATLLVLIAALALAGCTPATLKQRNDYWADQSRSAQAYNQRVRFLVLHYTGGDGPRALQVLTGPRVSSHYLIGVEPEMHGGDPIVRQLVDEHARAWHAGTSAWGDRSHINDSSIGIEIVNAGPVDITVMRRWQPYTAAQIDALVTLLRDLVRRYDIAPYNVVGHADVSPGRKIDPGPAFPWQQLYHHGIGAWPDESTVQAYRRAFFDTMPTMSRIQSALARYGYKLETTGELDRRTRAVLTSFQMHFRPARYDGIPDVDTLARLWALNAKYH